jgi:hypothetical protein
MEAMKLAKTLWNYPLQQNTMVTCPRIIILLTWVFLACMDAVAGTLDSAIAPGAFGVSGDIRTFLDNIEYSTAYRTGETIFGASAVLRFVYRPSERLRFAVGAYGLRRFGDECFFSRALPVFSAQYASERLSLIIGELVSADAHGLPDVLYRQEYRFDPGIEEGMQVRLRSGHFSEDLWVTWDSLNTPHHREHFTAGSASFFSFGHITFPLFVVADHTGGELYHCAGQPVQEHFGGAAGIAASYPLRSEIGRIFGQIVAAGSTYRVRSGNGEEGGGYGIMGNVGVSPLGFDCSVQWFKGRDFWVPTGDPLYRSDRPVYSLEAARSCAVAGHAVLSGGIRFETEACSLGGYFKNPMYRFWISLCDGFEKRLGR